MRINNNIMAMNTHRQLSINNSSTSKSLEKLSSGFRINRAGDDAAGLAISEKMRAQIRGLTMASKNSQDGISLIQTAEGALQETQAILQRMRELAVQASSDTNVEIDRAEIQKEINQLTSEINRIGNTTEFNTMKLLDGSRSSTAVEKYMAAATGNITIGTAKGVTVAAGAIDLKDSEITIGGDAFDNGFDFGDIDISAANTIEIFKDADGKLNVVINAADTAGNTISFNDKIDVTFTDGEFTYDMHEVTFTITEADFAAATVGAKTTIDLDVAKGANAEGEINTLASFKENIASAAATISAGITISSDIDKYARFIDIKATTNTMLTVTIKDADGNALQTDKLEWSAAATAGVTWSYDNHGIKFDLTFNADTAGTIHIEDLALDTTQKTRSLGDQSLAFQVGANESQSMSLSLGDMTASSLEISSVTGGGDYVLVRNVTNGTNNTEVEYALDVSTSAKAAKAITVINDAIQSVSSERSKLGAIQNRLEHTIKNLDTSAENLQAAESRIRDVDMAKEMMEFTKQNILQQAATAMLAQANQAPQAVLQLLR